MLEMENGNGKWLAFKDGDQDEKKEEADGKEPEKSPPFNMRPGDWMCPKCDAHQFARNRQLQCRSWESGGS